MWQKMWIDKVTKSRGLNKVLLTLIWVGFSGTRFAMGGEGVKLPRQKFLELFHKLEIWYVSTHTYVVSENIPLSIKNPLILLISAFFFK